MKKTILWIIVILTVVVVLNLPLFERFTIIDGKTNKIVYIKKVSEIREFYISFIHSVNRTPVNEYYEVIKDKLVLSKAVFYSYGAGMPEASDKSVGNIKVENGSVRIDNINRVFDSITVYIGTYANHTFHFNDQGFNLSKYVKPQHPAIFKVKRVSLYAILRRAFYE